MPLLFHGWTDFHPSFTFAARFGPESQQPSCTRIERSPRHSQHTRCCARRLSTCRHKRGAAPVLNRPLIMTERESRQAHWFDRKEYDTRLDRFRIRNALGVVSWAQAAGMSRNQLNKYRSGVEPSAASLARLVRAASTLLGRRVTASELCDLGEHTAVCPIVKPPPRRSYVRKQYASRFDALIRRTGWPITPLAEELNISKVALLRLRARAEHSPLAATVRKVVIGFRRLGHDVKASDVVDVGEDYSIQCRHTKTHLHTSRSHHAAVPLW